MQRITVIIPTRNRLEKLRATLATIPAMDWLNVKVVCDGDRETFAAVQAMEHTDIEPVMVSGHLGAVYCRNFIAPTVQDGLLYATDDITFPPRAFTTYLEDFNAAFPDDDGVLGIAQNNTHSRTGIALIGRKFLDRYPGRQPFFPEYWHFAAQEVEWLAEKVGKFAYCEKAKTTHYSPNRDRTLMDQTHKDARHFKEHDFKIRDARVAAGLVWGDA